MPGKGTTGPWGRLKPPAETDQDGLQSMGLPSKGDGRLLDLKTQEKFYTKIVERYMAECCEAGGRDELLRRFSAVEGAQPQQGRAGSRSGLDDVLAALRKLREGIVAAQRSDDFALQAYLFNIRLAILARQPDAYHPAILHLLRVLHPRHALSSIELHEVAAYLVLDTACRRGRLGDAYALRARYALVDAKLAAVLRALAHDNAPLFWRLRNAVDGHCARIMLWAEPLLRRHVLKCIGRSYLSVDVAFVERVAGASWDQLTREGVGWQLEGGRVTIRKPRAA
ncbi:hypothetical protein CDD82_4191 [Ophiocordyceps australis]|uniref:CSN8/PSMD8/EIF3K domain-containing protein n=1 Tax=Ophiocordyceps australis TaxID=1399860 RepID=A0A2C5Z7N0_9HYPO|nr:hypothetical protein CDD82_4191 [Ophiocordyceps australis]